MALANIAGWNENTAGSACGASDKPAACGATDGEELARIPVTITKYADGYRTYLLGDIVCGEGHRITIGIHVAIAEANCWGDIDHVMFNYVGD